jgi:F0F1-type ATP synthase membrane subunit c/vacuolar-type H+-ATPase subunit K
MLEKELLYGINEWVILIVIFIFFFVCAQFGSYRGRRAAKRVSPETRSHIATIEGSALGLLALLLGFAFAMSLTRFDVRKQVLLEETNDIQTTYLRAELLPERYRMECKNLLKEYVESRLEYYRAGVDSQKIAKALAWTRDVQGKLWAKAVEAGRENPEEVITGYFISSLNETIDDHTKRITAMDNHIPESIIFLLIFAGALAIGVTGFSAGLHNNRLVGLRFLQICLLLATLLVIIDLDRPRRGLIKVNERNLVDLQQVMYSSVNTSPALNR